MKKSLFQMSRTRSYILLVAIILISAVVTTWYYRNHLMWKYMEWRKDLYAVKAVPCRVMPETKIPDDWVECSADCLKFRLPANLAATKQAFTMGRGVGFDDRTRKVLVCIEAKDQDSRDFLNLASRLNPAVSSHPMTLPQFQRECLQTGADTFRWSMSPREVQWHSFCHIWRVIDAENMESFFSDELEGILLYNHSSDVKQKFLTISWESVPHSVYGYIHVIYRGEDFDPDWVRALCESMTIDHDGATTE